MSACWKTPVRAPQANAFCERLVGTIHRACLDFLIPINQRHVKIIINEFARHYNRGRPHSSLGPGIPEPQGTAFRREPIGTAARRLPRQLKAGSRWIAS